MFLRSISILTSFSHVFTLLSVVATQQKISIIFETTRYPFFLILKHHLPILYLRADKELSTSCNFLETEKSVANKVNINKSMNKFLIRSALFWEQINPKDEVIVYDFDHPFIPAEKYDATYSYKKQRGYFPGIGSIGNIPVYIEGRNGNCNVKTEQVTTHKRAMESLRSEGVFINRFRADSGSYIKSVTDYLSQDEICFFIRANNCNTLLMKASNSDNWDRCNVNNQDMEIAEFDYEFGEKTHRMVAYRVNGKNEQINIFTGDSKKYLFVITNDREMDKKQVVEFYNQRDDSERIFDIQNNDFNWNSMPHSWLEENTVYLIFMAVAHIIYKWLLNLFSALVKGLTNTSRIKKFIFRFVAIVAKFTKSGRRQIIHLATDNNALMALANSS